MQQRRLVLVRHAQAADGPVDVERPLTGHGARRAEAIGGWLAEAGVTPERVVVSPARRARQTWARAGGGTPGAVDERIYVNTLEALLAAVQDTPEDVGDLVVVGHNPSIGVLAAVLDDGEGDPAASRALAGGFPTGGVAVLELGTSFAAVGPGTARLDAFAVPGA